MAKILPLQIQTDMIFITNAQATEADQYLIFDVTLLEDLTWGQSLTVALEATGGTARQGPERAFNFNSKNPFDFSNALEFSIDDGRTWVPAVEGNQVTFGFGLNYLKVRLPINDDGKDEGVVPETIELKVSDVIVGSLKASNLSNTGIGSIVDDDGLVVPEAVISDAIATEGDEYAVFDVGLSSSSNRRTILQLEVVGLTAQGGARADFKNNIKSLKKILGKDELKGLKKRTKAQLKNTKNAKKLEAFIEKLDSKEGKALEKALRKENVDFANQEFEVSYDRGKSWRVAKKGQVEIPQGFVDLTQVRVPLSDDDFTETTETFALQVVNVVEGNLSSTSDVGFAAIVDNDPAAAMAVFDQTFQAEDAVVVGANIIGDDVGENPRGAEGIGYVDYKNPSGDYIEWTVNAPESGFYELSWRYQNGSSNRPLELLINGGVEDPSLDFPNAGGWTSNDWGFVSKAVELNAGNNTIRLLAIGSSGGNFDYMRVVSTGIDVVISDAVATEGTDPYLVFDVGLAIPSDETITLDLAALDGTARGGLEADFGIDPAGDPIDYANQEFEVSADGGISWQPAVNGTEVTFAPGDRDRKVRLAVHDDAAVDGAVPETMQLAVDSVLVGTVRDISDRGEGLIIDNEAAPSTPPISLLPASDIRIENNVSFTFDGQDGGMTDGDVDKIGFTMVDPASKPDNPDPIGGVVGYWPDKLNVTNGVLQITTTDGLMFKGSDSQDNALGIGLNLPSDDLKLATTLVDLPAASGGFAQAGLWFGQATSGGDGTSEDNYIKLVVVSPNPGDYQLQALMEQAGTIIDTVNIDIPNNPASVALELFLDPGSRAVSAFYSVSGGTTQPVTIFENVPDEWFSFDQAGIDPTIATRSFGGVFASHRRASEQVFSFDEFSVTNEESPIDPLESDLPFDRWTLPVNNATAMDVGPDGRLYVATLFGTIYAFDIDPKTRSFEQEIIDTIRIDEGTPADPENRLTLGIAVDPDSTAENVTLWVGHSDGSVNNGSINSAEVSKLSGPGFAQKEDVVTGLPRAIANHALNSIDFGPDGNLYLWFGGNTGAGAPNTEESEFKDRAEQVFSAALLEVDIQHYKGLDPSKPYAFDGDASSPVADVDETTGEVIPGEFIDEFYARKEMELGREYTEVTVFASGLRNTYDGVFHSNGQIYAPDNGLGVTGSVPPVPRLGSAGLLDANGDPILDADGKQLLDRDLTVQFGDVNFDNPLSQPDPLNRIVEGAYYGHPNPYRDEVVFKDGTFQGFDNTDADNTNDIPIGHPEYTTPFLNLGNNKSANGIIEYTADNFFGALQGDLLITSFSSGDDVSRVQLSADGLSPVLYTQNFVQGFIDPLPIAMGTNGSDLEGLLFIGEFNGGSVTVLEPLGVWRQDLPSLPNPLGVLDAGSTVLNNQLYMVGGKTNNGPINDVYVYTPGDPIDENDDVWTTLPTTLPGVAVENPAVVAFNNKVYAFGGSTAPFSGAQSNAVVYDPATGVWTDLPNMPTARGGAQAAVLDSKIYVVGGLDSNGASLDTVEAFDPLTGTWLTGSADPDELLTRRDNLGIAVADGKLHVFGGRTREANGTTTDGGLTSMEIYDPVSDAWTFGAPMLTGRRTMAVGNIDGKIQVVGGEGTPALDISEEYNPATGVWRTLPSMTTGRHGAAYGTIGDVVYVAGGGPNPGGSFTDVTEAFTV